MFKRVNDCSAETIELGARKADDLVKILRNNGVEIYINTSSQKQYEEGESISKNFHNILGIEDIIKRTSKIATTSSDICVELKYDGSSLIYDHYSIETRKWIWSKENKNFFWNKSGPYCDSAPELYIEYNDKFGHIYLSQDLMRIDHIVNPFNNITKWFEHSCYEPSVFWERTDSFFPVLKKQYQFNPNDDAARKLINLFPLDRFFLNFPLSDILCVGTISNGIIIPNKIKNIDDKIDLMIESALEGYDYFKEFFK